ncbi:MAG: hypothetical protein WCI97_07570 [Bacteroidota bacterium]
MLHTIERTEEIKPDISVSGKSTFTKHGTFKWCDKTFKNFGHLIDFSSGKGKLKFIVAVNTYNYSRLIDQLKTEKMLTNDFAFDKQIAKHNQSETLKMEIVLNY